MRLIDNLEKYRETAIHGDNLFPFSIYYNQGQGHILNYHWHNEVEIILLTEGEAVFQLDSAQYQLSSEQAVVVNSGVIHNGYALNQTNCHFYAIVFNLELLKSSYEDACQLKYISPILKNTNRFQEFLDNQQLWSQEIINILHKMINIYYQKKPGFELKLKALLYQVVYQYIVNNQMSKNEADNNHKINRLKKALYYIHDNYEKKISLAEIADASNLSKYYFCRIFKSEIGQTPIEYLNFYRLYRARMLLQETDRQIVDIAIDVGFDNPSYFIRLFKKSYHCTPGEFREKAIGE